MLLQNKEQASQGLLALVPDQQGNPHMVLRGSGHSAFHGDLQRVPQPSPSHSSAAPVEAFRVIKPWTLSLRMQAQDQAPALAGCDWGMSPITSEPTSPHTVRTIKTTSQDCWEDFRKPTNHSAQPTTKHHSNETTVCTENQSPPGLEFEALSDHLSD